MGHVQPSSQRTTPCTETPPWEFSLTPPMPLATSSMRWGAPEPTYQPRSGSGASSREPTHAFALSWPDSLVNTPRSRTTDGPSITGKLRVGMPTSQIMPLVRGLVWSLCGTLPTASTTRRTFWRCSDPWKTRKTIHALIVVILTQDAQTVVAGTAILTTCAPGVRAGPACAG